MSAALDFFELLLTRGLQVIGDIVCNTVMVVNRGKVLGDITAVNLTIGPKVMFFCPSKA